MLTLRPADMAITTSYFSYFSLKKHSHWSLRPIPDVRYTHDSNLRGALGPNVVWFMRPGPGEPNTMNMVFSSAGLPR